MLIYLILLTAYLYCKFKRERRERGRGERRSSLSLKGEVHESTKFQKRVFVNYAIDAGTHGCAGVVDVYVDVLTSRQSGIQHIHSSSSKYVHVNNTHA